MVSKKVFWLVTSNLSLATRLVSWKISVEPWETPDQRQPGSLSLSCSAGTGGRELWEQGWARTFLNNEGVSNFAEMEDYNVEAKWTMAEWNSQNTLSLLYKGFQVANINFVRKRKAWEICQGISQRNKRYVSAEEINNCLLKWDFFSRSEYRVNVDLLSCRTSYHLSCYQRESRALSYDKCKSLLFQWNTERTFSGR